jgi:hypothetical protein
MIPCTWDLQPESPWPLSAGQALRAIQQGRQQSRPAPLARRIGAARIELVKPLVRERQVIIPDDAKRIEQIAIPGDPLSIAQPLSAA